MKRQIRALIEQYMERVFDLQAEKQTEAVKGQLYALENVIEDLQDILRNI